jgi:hypothetical protein
MVFIAPPSLPVSYNKSLIVSAGNIEADFEIVLSAAPSLVDIKRAMQIIPTCCSYLPAPKQLACPKLDKGGVEFGIKEWARCFARINIEVLSLESAGHVKSAYGVATVCGL